jgi:hypothetical protein
MAKDPIVERVDEIDSIRSEIKGIVHALHFLLGELETGFEETRARKIDGL